MKAVFVENQKLKICQVEQPKPKASEVLVKIYAAGINRADLFQVEGSYPPPVGASPILGLEVAGEILQIGADVKQWKIGDKVCAVINGGAYAEYVVINHELLLDIPKNLNYLEAASLPEAIYTCYLNIIAKANLKSGEKFLVHAGASGIGSIAIQMAKAFGAYVITTASTSTKCIFCKEIGADLVINYQQQDFEQQIKTNIGKIDVILDMFGQDYFNKNLSCLNYNGRMVIIGLLKGNIAKINLGKILLKNITIMGSTLRSQPLENKISLTKNIRNFVWKYVETSQIKPIIDKVFNFDDVAFAHEHMRNNQHLGKIVLQVNNN
jgi:NADPH2:quinone reductase